MGTAAKLVWHSEPSYVWPQTPLQCHFPRQFTPRHARPHTQNTQHLHHTSRGPGLHTFTPTPLLLSLDASNPHCPMHMTSQEWKTNLRTHKGWQPWPMMALPYFIIFHRIPNFYSRIFYLPSPQPVKWFQFVYCCCFLIQDSQVPSLPTVLFVAKQL